MGAVRSLDLWLSLSHCGDEAPGIDLVPRRLDELVPTGGDEATFPKPGLAGDAERPAGDLGNLRPSSSRATRSSSTTSSCTGPPPTPRPNPRFAIETGSSARSVSPRITPRWLSDLKAVAAVGCANRPHMRH